ncbi:MAG: hypothetical protein ACTSVL_01020, partial [Promethearchaeota archaeon]
NQTEFSTQYQHMNLNQIVRKNFLLRTTRINVSISDLNNNILTDYKEKILIIVGHGSQSGLSDEKQLMEWNSVRNLILNQSSALTILDSCYGNNATDGIQNAIGFSNEIDNRVAAYFTSAMIFKVIGEEKISQAYMNQAIENYITISQSPENAQYLYYVSGGGGGGSSGPSGLSFYEILFGWLMFCDAVFFLVADLKLPGSIWQKVVAHIAANTLTVLPQIIAFALVGELSIEGFWIEFSGVISDIISAFYVAITDFDFDVAEMSILIAAGCFEALALCIEALVDGATGGAATIVLEVVKLTVFIANLAIIGSYFVKEYNDDNDVVG